MRDRRAWVVAATTVLAVAVACVAWIAYAHPAALGEPTDPPLKAGDYVWLQFLWAFEAIAVFPTVTELAPTIVYALWGIPLIAMVVLTCRQAARRVRFALAATVVLLVAIPSVFTAITYADEGISWQGRYSLPLWLGVSALAGLVAAGWTRERLPALVPMVFVMMATAVTVSTVAVGRRETLHGPVDPAAAHVPGGLVLVGVLTAAGMLLPLLGVGRAPARTLGGLQEVGGSDRGNNARSSESEPSGATST
jgi:hypothetical protein